MSGYIDFGSSPFNGSSAPQGGATAFLWPPAPTLVAIGTDRTPKGSAHMVAPPPSISAQGHSSAGERSAELTCPRPTLSAYSGANATLSSSVPTLHITATVTNFGAAALRAPAGSVSAGGTVSSTATADLNAPMATLAGYFGSICSLTLTGGPTVFASGTTGGVGGADIRSPSPRLVSSGMAQGYGSANLLAPAGHLGATARAWLTAPSPMLTATGHAVVAATYEAYAINLSHVPGNQEPVDEVTHYTNFPFNGIVRYQSSYYGWGDDGLYLLEGTTDDANEIQYVVRTCIDDFKLTNEKNVVSAYFAGRIGPDMTVTLYAGEDGQASYNYHTANGSQARTHREKFARGVTDRYFAIGVSGKGALELADIELEINKLKRKT